MCVAQISMVTTLPFGICTENLLSVDSSRLNSTLVRPPSNVDSGTFGGTVGVKRVPVKTASASTTLFKRGSDGKQRKVSRKTARVYSCDRQE